MGVCRKAAREGIAVGGEEKLGCASEPALHPSQLIDICAKISIDRASIAALCDVVSVDRAIIVLQYRHFDGLAISVCLP